MHGVRSPAFVEMKGNVSTIDLANGKRTPVGLPKGNILANPHKADGAAQASKICKMHTHPLACSLAYSLTYTFTLCCTCPLVKRRSVE